MGSYKDPKELIQEYLDKKAKGDELFEKMYNKTTDRHQEILDVINGNMKEVIKANSCKL